MREDSNAMTRFFHLSLVVAAAMMPARAAAAVDRDALLEQYHNKSLSNLVCNRLAISVSEAGRSVGLTRKVLYEALVEAVRVRLPRLRIEPATSPVNECEARLNLTVSFLPFDTDGTLRFAASVRLEQNRMSRLIGVGPTDDNLVWNAVVWKESSLVVGPSKAAQRTVLELVDKFVGKFAIAYRKAGNL
jgi:hypothetical protein